MSVAAGVCGLKIGRAYAGSRTGREVKERRGSPEPRRRTLCPEFASQFAVLISRSSCNLLSTLNTKSVLRAVASATRRSISEFTTPVSVTCP